MHDSANRFSVAGRTIPTILCVGLFVFLSVTTCLAGNTKNIMLTGYWPPSNEMLRKFSTAPNQNPAGWQGQNWEGRGYDIYAYFPEFPGGTGSNPKGNGDFEVDYQDVSNDFWWITGNIHPVAILSYGKGTTSWELEYNARNLSIWSDDCLNPWQPTPSPPDNSVPAGYVRSSTLPVQAIADTINNSGTGVNARVDWGGDAGAFLCEYMAYHDAWYQSFHSDPCDQYRCLAAGFTHVPGSLSVSTATTACEIALRTAIDYLDSQLLSYTVCGTVTYDGSPLAGVVMNGLPGNPVTDANGFYAAKVGAGWSGTIAPIEAGYAFNPAERAYNNVRTDQLSQDYAAYTAISQTIEFDAASSDADSSAGTTLNWSHTLGSGSNRILIVAAVCEDAIAKNQVISSVKYNGVNMTKVLASSKSWGYIKADLYYMLDADLPSSPGSYIVSVTYNDIVVTHAGGAISLKNVKQQVPETVVTNSLASATAISTEINTLSSGAWIVDVVGHSRSGSFSSSTSAERWDQSSGNHTGAGSTTLAALGGPAAVGWDFSGSNGTIIHSLAAFAPAQTAIPAVHTLTASSTGGGYVAAPGEGAFQYESGAVVDVVASPEADCHFVNWTGSGVVAGRVADPNAASTTITMNGNYTIAASFAIDQYTITATADANGSINPSGQAIKEAGQDQWFIAVSKNGYAVQKWYLDDGGVQSGGSTFALTNIRADHTTHVTFERLPWDDFNDNRQGAAWWSFADSSENVWVVEDANRLNLRAAGAVNNLVADYVANGWSFDANEDFSFKVDFHYARTSNQDGWVGITVENDGNNYVAISAGSDSSGPYLYYEKIVDGSAIFEEEPRSSDDGTLYVSYDAGADQLYLSFTGYGAANAWKTLSGLLQNQWASGPVSVAIGGGCGGGGIDNGQAYLDNFEVTAGRVLGWPSAADLNRDGFIDWLDTLVIRQHWLEVGVGIEGDLNNDGIVNFRDFAEFALAW